MPERSMTSRLSKRSLDLAAASAGVIILSPILASIAVLIRSKHDGPVIYKGVRAGLHGRPFVMLKFRTMVANAEFVGGPSTPDDDRRLTSIGTILRRYKLDELPQLFNVIRGDMSLVGPRPQVLSEVAGYSDEERLLLTVRPGITDRASLRFHNEGQILAASTDPDRTYRELIRPGKMRLGLEYVHRASLREDVAILWATIVLITRRRKGGDTSALSQRARV
jgi:lipopolysaccharide/colanic/teichoic acid biosynthesis glycosyltransferase